MILRDGMTRLELNVVAVGHTDFDRGDVRLRVRVSSLGFKGDYEDVWVRGEDLERFIDELSAVERDRTGGASLASMSPSDLEIRIGIRDRAGHASAVGHLGRAGYGATGDAVETQIGFSIDLDPTLLATLRDEFRSLLEQPGR